MPALKQRQRGCFRCVANPPVVCTSVASNPGSQPKKGRKMKAWSARMVKGNNRMQEKVSEGKITSRQNARAQTTSTWLLSMRRKPTSRLYKCSKQPRQPTQRGTKGVELSKLQRFLPSTCYITLHTHLSPSAFLAPYVPLFLTAHMKEQTRTGVKHGPCSSHGSPLNINTGGRNNIVGKTNEASID